MLKTAWEGWVIVTEFKGKIASSTLLVALLVCTPVTAEQGQNIAPWAERVIEKNLDISNYSGELSGDKLQRFILEGERLFEGKFTAEDGFGRPAATQAILPTKRKHPIRSSIQRLPGPDANSCASCHNDPVIGAAGDITTNVFVSEGFTNPDFDTTDPQFSNERNTNHLMGAGLVELIAREMTRDLIALRKKALMTARAQNEPVAISLETKGVSFGELKAFPDGLVDTSKVEGVDTDLNVRPFSQKGVFTSLRQFTVNAMNHHHGMQADERFGARWTGEIDFDEDGKIGELSEGDVSALVAWQATLRAPYQMVPENADWQKAAEAGLKQFEAIGCASCHMPAMPLESTLFTDPGPFDVAGTLRSADSSVRKEAALSYDLGQFDWVKSLPRNEEGHVLVPIFSDLKRHKISDQKNNTLGNELLAQRFVERDQFQTSELWGIASTAPYGHRGDQTTLHEVILAHGGEGLDAATAYSELSDAERSSIIAFLKTLVIE